MSHNIEDLKRVEVIKELRAKDMTLEEIGNIFKISRQRVFQILNKNRLKIDTNPFVYPLDLPVVDSKDEIGQDENINNS
jgi:DNA-binding transcriptional MerR regulator